MTDLGEISYWPVPVSLSGIVCCGVPPVHYCFWLTYLLPTLFPPLSVRTSLSLKSSLLSGVTFHKVAEALLIRVWCIQEFCPFTLIAV